MTVLARSNSLSNTAIFFSAALNEAGTLLGFAEGFAFGRCARRVAFRGVDFRVAFVRVLFFATFAASVAAGW